MIIIKDISLENEISISRTATFFQTKMWLNLWQKHFGNGCFVWGVYEDKNLIGIAPFTKSKNKQSFSPNKIELLGISPVLGKELVSDFGDIIILEGKEKIVWEEVLNKLKRDFENSILELNFIREDSPSLAILKDLNGKVEEVDTSPYIKLPKTWDEYLLSLERHDRHELKRKINKIEREQIFKICLTSKEATIDEFLRLTSLSTDDKKSFFSPPMKAFFKDIVSTLDDKTVKLYFLKIKEENVAATLSFNFHNQVLLYNSGFDQKYSYLSPSLVLKSNLIKQAIEEKKEVFDFLRGNERYKYDLGGKDRKLYKITFKL